MINCRPQRSEIGPTTMNVKAMAIVGTDSVAAAAAGDTSKFCAMLGSSGWTKYRAMKLAKPPAPSAQMILR